MKKIKVVSIVRSRLGENRGTPIRIRNILSSLAKSNNLDLTIFSWDDVYLIRNTKHLFLSKNKLNDLIKIYSFIKENEIDIVMGHTMSSCCYLMLLKFFTKAKVVLEMHGFTEEEGLMHNDISKFRYSRNKLIYSIFYKLCDLIITCSDTATKILLKYNNNTVTVFGGVDLSIFNPYINLERNNGNNSIVVGYAGNASIWQGLDFLIDTFKELTNEYPEFKLKLLISDKKRKVIYHPKIQYYDPVEYKKVPPFLIGCDILVIPRSNNKVNEISFPSKLLEYMAMGKAVIASDTSDMDKIIINGQNGLLYKSESIEDFKKCLIKLKDSKYRQYLGRNAFEFAKNNLTWEKQTQIIFSKLKELL